jgi:hypothetical protein
MAVLARVVDALRAHVAAGAVKGRLYRGRPGLVWPDVQQPCSIGQEQIFLGADAPPPSAEVY